MWLRFLEGRMANQHFLGFSRRLVYADLLRDVSNKLSPLQVGLHTQAMDEEAKKGVMLSEVRTTVRS